MRNNYHETEIERHTGESFLIGDSIEIRAVLVKGNRIRFRCRAPGSMQILPKEMLEGLVRENRKASLSRLPGLDDLCAIQEEE